MAPRPTIAVIVDDPRTRSSLGSDLQQRFATHYEVVELSSARAASALAEIATVAVVVTTVELDGEASGIELLTQVHRTHPDTRRVLLVARGQWTSHPVRRAMALGQIDGYLFVPWVPKEQWLYLPTAEYLAEWSRTQPPELHAVTIVGRRRDEGSHVLRDLLSAGRGAIPVSGA